MNTAQLTTLFTNAGFITTATVNNVGVVVSLKNRAVDSIEAQIVLGSRRNRIIRSGNSVVVMPVTFKVR